MWLCDRDGDGEILGCWESNSCCGNGGHREDVEWETRLAQKLATSTKIAKDDFNLMNIDSSVLYKIKA